MTLKIEPIALLQDNYAWLATVDGARECAVVDPSEAGPVAELLKERNLELKMILATHHHWDHVNGIEDLVALGHDVEVYCSAYDFKKGRVPEATHPLEDNAVFELLGHHVQCMLVPGHTLGALAYYLKKEEIVFTGDTLFTAGCGRLFEGTAAQMYDSLSRLGKLPSATKVYCGHEYTENNLQFASELEPSNVQVKKRLESVQLIRASGAPTVPATIGEEKQTNPFMRATCANLSALVRRSDPVDVFTELRKKKDSF